MITEADIVGAIWQSYVRPEHKWWTWRMLQHLYDEPHRVYHNIAHIRACLFLLDSIRDELVDKHIAELALLWHDAVYVPGAPENEEVSAELLCGLAPILFDRDAAAHACSAILATRHREVSYGSNTVDAVVDIDLSILGSSPDDYAAYVAAVRREYAHASDEAWRVGRMAFLTQMLERDTVFRLRELRDRFETQARSNMSTELRQREAERGGGK